MVMGRDYDLVAKPVSDLQSMVMPELIGMKEDFRQAGFHLAQMLIDLIGGKPANRLQMLETL
jgi:DNA-binding LacI/PurR family transcriptional regulator